MEKLENILDKVRKPGRYLGNEWNARKKPAKPGSVKVALCFPDLYEVGMSHLGFRIIYSILNKREDVVCERVFSPGVDMEQELRKNSVPVFSLESKTPISEFDIVGFSFSYELSYTNMLNMLDLAQIPIFSKDRADHDPIIIGGGFCCFNPEPLADFADLFVIGEAEEVIEEIIDAYKKAKEENLPRKIILEKLSSIQGVYVPSTGDGNKTVKKRIAQDLDSSCMDGNNYLVPNIEIIHDRISVEIMRGCPFRCRFCQAQAVYRPKRERSKESVVKSVRDIYSATGYESISLVSLSSGTHSRIDEIINDLKENFDSKDVSISLPSLRVENSLERLPALLSERRRTGLTFAPEAGTERLRKVINKNINTENLLNCITQALSMGWQRAKLYFMIGFPTETQKDLEGIVDLIGKVANLRTKDNRKCQVTASVACFIPKPHTPFQWEAMDDINTLLEKQKFIRGKVKSKNVKLDFHKPMISFLEAALSRGDRAIGKVIYRAWKNGAKFDGWDEFFNFDLWMNAFKEEGVDPGHYVNRKRDIDERLAWDFIDVGIPKEELAREREAAFKDEADS